jgi:hypothetical protein
MGSVEAFTRLMPITASAWAIYDVGKACGK